VNPTQVNHQTTDSSDAALTRILIVDDHPDMRRLLSVTMGKKYRILEAADGVSALRMIEHHNPRLVLLDVMMPGPMNGLQLLSIIKGDSKLKHIIVGMVTARGQSADGAEARQRGADAYFIKPFSPRTICAWVDDQLQ